MAKKYITGIKYTGSGGRYLSLYVDYYPDTPNKNLRIYYLGSDMGQRYEYLGNAAREIERVRNCWIENGIPADEIRECWQTKEEFNRSSVIFYV